jgi:hypothetical protein
MIVLYVKVGILIILYVHNANLSLSHQLNNSPFCTESEWWAGAWSDVGKETGIYYVIIYVKFQCWHH